MPPHKRKSHASKKVTELYQPETTSKTHQTHSPKQKSLKLIPAKPLYSNKIIPERMSTMTVTCGRKVSSFKRRRILCESRRTSFKRRRTSIYQKNQKTQTQRRKATQKLKATSHTQLITANSKPRLPRPRQIKYDKSCIKKASNQKNRVFHYLQLIKLNFLP